VSLEERFNAAPPVRRGMPCPVAVIMEQLPPGDVAVLVAQFEKPVGALDRIATTMIAKLLCEEGHQIHPKGVERHRNRECRCFRGSGI
jgi:hypothetical protein